MNVFLIDWSYSVFEYFNSGIMKIVILILCLDVLLENRTLTLCSGIKCFSPIDVDSKPFEILFLLKVPNLVLRFNWIDQFFQQTDLVFKTPILFLNIVKFLFQRLLAIIWLYCKRNYFRFSIQCLSLCSPFKLFNQHLLVWNNSLIRVSYFFLQINVLKLNHVHIAHLFRSQNWTFEEIPVSFLQFYLFHLQPLFQ